MDFRSILFAIFGLMSLGMLVGCSESSDDGSGGGAATLEAAASSETSVSMSKELENLSNKHELIFDGAELQINLANSALLRLAVVGTAEAMQARSDAQHAIQEMALWKRDTDANFQNLKHLLTTANEKNQIHQAHIAALEKEKAEFEKIKFLLTFGIALMSLAVALLPFVLNRQLNKVLMENAALDRKIKLLEIAEKERRMEWQGTADLVQTMRPEQNQRDTKASTCSILEHGVIVL